jgi:hypothetical protein
VSTLPVKTLALIALAIIALLAAAWSASSPDDYPQGYPLEVVGAPASPLSNVRVVAGGNGAFIAYYKQAGQEHYDAYVGGFSNLDARDEVAKDGFRSATYDLDGWVTTTQSFPQGGMAVIVTRKP